MEIFFNKKPAAASMLKLAQNLISTPVSIGMERSFSAVNNLWTKGLSGLSTGGQGMKVGHFLKSSFGASGETQVVQQLFSKHEALSAIPQYCRKKEEIIFSSLDTY
jgi:hypothetical protein